MSKYKKEQGQSRFNAASLLIGIPTLITIYSLLSYGLSSLIFRLTRQPSAAWQLVIANITGFIVLYIIFHLFYYFHRKHVEQQGRSHHDFRNGRFYTDLLNDTLDAIAKISRGDFSVTLPTNERDPYNEIALQVNEMARELNSMENLRQEFISNVSHEIQSPLTSIRGYAVLLENNDLPSEQKQQYLKIIQSESRRLSGLSKNLLRLSSLEAGDQIPISQPYRLDKQLQNTAVLLEPQWSEKQINLEANLSPLTIKGDEELLSQVWINLLNNAVKFTPTGGKIALELTQTESQITCSITDTGIGISKQDQIHVFERFYKADKSRARALGGNGLGLAIVKKIIELHHGQVIMQSEEGKGSTFTVTLPKNMEEWKTN